jgi:hypothetical protein
MAMGTRKDRERQEDLWVAYTDMAVGPGHPFYVRLNEVLDGEGFDLFVEKLCSKFYADKLGRPGLTPGIYFRSLMIGYFEGIESERGIAWRLKDSLSLRRFLGIALDEDTPDHSTILNNCRRPECARPNSIRSSVRRTRNSNPLSRCLQQAEYLPRWTPFRNRVASGRFPTPKSGFALLPGATLNRLKRRLSISRASQEALIFTNDLAKLGHKTGTERKRVVRPC